MYQFYSVKCVHSKRFRQHWNLFSTPDNGTMKKIEAKSIWNILKCQTLFDFKTLNYNFKLHLLSDQGHSIQFWNSKLKMLKHFFFSQNKMVLSTHINAIRAGCHWKLARKQRNLSWASRLYVFSDCITNGCLITLKPGKARWNLDCDLLLHALNCIKSLNYINIFNVLLIVIWQSNA